MTQLKWKKNCLSRFVGETGVFRTFVGICWGVWLAYAKDTYFRTPKNSRINHFWWRYIHLGEKDHPKQQKNTKKITQNTSCFWHNSRFLQGLKVTTFQRESRNEQRWSGQTQINYHTSSAWNKLCVWDKAWNPGWFVGTLVVAYESF